jgi:hypothetical protein
MLKKNWLILIIFLPLIQYRPYDWQVPTFYNLIDLKIVFGWTTNDWFGKWKWLTEVLQNCPKLQNLTIHEVLFFMLLKNDSTFKKILLSLFLLLFLR